MSGGVRRLLRAVRRAATDADVVLATAVGLGTLALLAATATVGFVRDEGYYFRAAREYFGWFEGLWRSLLAGQPGIAFTDEVVRRAFGYNTEHPGLAKIAMGWTHRVFAMWLGWTSHATGYRLASMAFVALGSAFTYLFGARAFSRPVALLGVALLLACPHVFYHAHVACFDGPIMGLTVVVTYAFWRSLTCRAWVLGAGVAWGTAIAVKHNALFLPATLILAYAGARAHRFSWRRGALHVPPVPVSLFAMAVIGPILFYATYPYGWHDPVARIGDYLRFHLHHEHYPVDYMGTMYVEPPFPVEFPFVFSALTIPLPVLVTGCAGVAAAAARAAGSLWRAWSGTAVASADPLPEWLLVTGVVVPPAIIALPNVPIFGGTKHWMTMMPFFCLAAAGVIVQAAAYVHGRLGRGRWLASGALVILALALPAADTARTHPLAHTYFNELAGGHQGGAALGMPRTFWGGDARGLLEVVNREAAPGARLFTHRMNQDSFQAYQRDGLLRDDIRWTLELREADWALINHQREYRDSELEVWALRGDRRPVAVLAFDGVPIASVYRLVR